jgi:MFS family permease
MKSRWSALGCQRNIKILYILSFLRNLWFWLGIWVLYYLLFTDFTGIGIIETVMIVTILVLEIPSGVFADMVGKKKALILAFIAIIMSEGLMGLAINFNMLVGSVIFGSIGTVMLSGTFEAITYDSLKEVGKEKLYDKVFSRQKSIAYVASALATIIGGLMYTYIDHRAPFFAVAGVTITACILSFFLKEPQVDTEKFSLRKYRKQLKQGFSQLFFAKKFRSVVIMMILAMVVPLVMYEMLADLLVTSYGASPVQISIGILVIYIVSSIIVYFSGMISGRFGALRSFVLVSLIYGTGLLMIPFVNFVGAIIVGSILTGTYAINQVIQSDIVNQKVSSKYRATTLSTMNMLISLPYVLTAIVLGYFADLYSVQNVIFVLGVAMIFLVIIFSLNSWRLNKS